MANPAGRGGFGDNPHNINRGGRPKRRPLTDAIREILDEPAAAGSPETKAERAARTLVELAISGDMTAARLMLAYTEGLPKQQVEFDYRKAAVDAAEELGIDAELLIREIEMIARQAMDRYGD